MPTNNPITAYEKVCTLITFMDRKVKDDIFMASYGESEVRFYTNDLHEPKLITVIKWTDRDYNLENVLAIVREVTVTI